MGSMVEFASNGDTASGYLALPDSGRGPGVIVVQEWWGLDSGIKEMADRLAADGSSPSRPTCTTVSSPATPRWTRQAR
jgi:dienelactone hydrolase